MRRAGLLNQEIEIYRQVVTSSEFGQEVTAWEYITTTRARIIRSAQNRYTTTDNQILYPMGTTFVVRYYVEIDDFDYILYQGHFYSIDYIDRNQETQEITVYTSLLAE